MPKRHTEAVMHSSARSDWRTPPELFQALDDEFEFDIDVAADVGNHLVLHWFTDALNEEWGVGNACFMNPPYSKLEHLPIEPWIKKAFYSSMYGTTVVGVLPFNPQTKWYLRYVYGLMHRSPTEPFHAAMEERRIPHRVTFNRPDGTPADNAPGNTVIIVWRPDPGYVGPWQPATRYWSYR